MRFDNRRRNLTRAILATLAAAAIAVGLLAPAAWSATIKLTDGTVLEGTVEPIGSGSYVKVNLDDGGLKMLPADKIESVDGEPYGNAAPAVPAGDAAAGGGAAAALPDAGRIRADYDRILERSERVDEPVKAVDMWERFLAQDGLPEALKTSAERELARWKQLYTDGAERIRGSWVGGDDLKGLKDEVKELLDQAEEQERSNNTLDAMRNYQKALALYPNSFRAHYRLGYIKFHQGYNQPGGNPVLREARRHAMAAMRLQPRLPAVLSSMGAGLFVLKDYERGIEQMYEAVKIAETDLTVGNLLTALDSLPRRWLQANRDLREINLAVDPLRGKYNGGSLVWIEDYTHGVEDMNPDDPDSGPPGLRGNGSGFFVTADGYVLTNRHVAESDDGFYYRVRLSTKDDEGNFIEYPAQFVASDDEYDVALLKVELPDDVAEVEYLRLLEEDVPPVQADVMTAGYPTVGTGDFVFQTARGTVSSNETGDDEFDLFLDMKTTQGNSGGPIVDRNGHVIGITTAYRKVFDSIVSLAVGPRQIREFLSDVDEAPSLDYDSESDRTFEPVALAEELKPRTVLVLIFAGEADEIGGDDADDGGDDEMMEDEEEMDEEEAPEGPGAGEATPQPRGIR